MSEGKISQAEDELWLAQHTEYKERPARNFHAFLTDPHFLGTDETYKEIEAIGKEILTGKYREGILIGGIGSGKSYLSELIALWNAHNILCLEDPYDYYNIGNDKPITIINMGTNAQQAKNTVFTGIKNFIRTSPFFQQHIKTDNVLEREIKSDDGRLLFLCGNSKETTPLGLNIHTAILDEASWYLDNENRSLAEDIYFALQRRIVSRFGMRGLIMIITSPLYEHDFAMTKLKAEKDNKRVYTRIAKTWELKDRDTMKAETFDFTLNKDEEWKDIPVDFKDTFDSNPEKAMRDFGARPSLSLEGYYKNTIAVDEAINQERTAPVDNHNNFLEGHKAPDDEPRYIHIDLGLNREGGDACGFACGKFDGYVKIKDEEKVKIYFDLILQIKALPKDEIKFEDVREIVYKMKEAGYNIELVTYDGWQSIDSIQILKDQGINAETLSVDKTTEAHDALKGAIYDKRVDMYKHKVLIDELKGLELVKGKKVDHPPKGSKDVADSCAGVAYHITNKHTAQRMEFGRDIGVVG